MACFLWVVVSTVHILFMTQDDVTGQRYHQCIAGSQHFDCIAKHRLAPALVCAWHSGTAKRLLCA